MEFPTAGPNQWPRPGGGNMITWDTTTRCQSSQMAVAGYFYLAAYSADRLSVIPRPVDGRATVANCQAYETVLSDSELGYVSFSSTAGTAGCNPCTADCRGRTIPVIPTTWGGIKALYSR
jgi:hypothetical protein